MCFVIGRKDDRTMFILSVLNQKGGVGKSTLARSLTVELARAKQKVLLADLDTKQGTSINWHRRRLDHGIKPEIHAQGFADVKSAIKAAEPYDVLVIDGRPHASQTSLEAAKASDLVLLPTRLGKDDLDPTISLCHELNAKGISKQRLALALVGVGGDSPIDPEIREARDYIEQAGYNHLHGSIPEKKSYRRAQDVGLSLQETKYATLNKRVDQLLQSIFDQLHQLSNG